MPLIDLRPGLRGYLLTNAAISSAVSGSRIFPVIMPQGERADSIVYVRVLENEGYHMSGPSHLVGQRMQIDVWSQSTGSAARLADLVKDHLGGARGPWSYGGSSPGDFVRVQGAFMQTGFDDYDREAELYRMSRDYMIWYEAEQ